MILLYESSFLSLINTGYVLASGTDEKIRLKKAMKALSNEMKEHGNYVFGDKQFLNSLDTTALASVNLATTAASGTTIVEAMDANTFVNVAKSTNYTVDTTGKALKATLATQTCTIVSNAYTVTSSNYCVLKSTETLGTGTIQYFVSRDGGTTFKQVYKNGGVVLFDTPTGTNFCFKVVVAGNAQVNAIGFNLR